MQNDQQCPNSPNNPRAHRATRMILAASPESHEILPTHPASPTLASLPYPQPALPQDFALTPSLPTDLSVGSSFSSLWCCPTCPLLCEES